MLNMCMNWTNYQHPTPTFSRVLRWEKENDRGRKYNLTWRRCTRCCNFAQIWHPSPYNYTFRSFEVGSEKGRTEEIEFDNLDTTTHNFVFPNLEVGHGKSKLQTCKSHCRRCMRCWTCAWIEQTTNTPHVHFLEFWGGKRQATEEENVVWLAAGARDVVNLHKYDTPAPPITFSGVLR